ncbi:MAG TPA: GAF domain-containing SpoIIE family protein phosphatase [Acidimicrobiales bacterium]|nr:GAF domain-containing SpoIIE family protein phosphatase [Acidimicrobiales bacterium]
MLTAHERDQYGDPGLPSTSSMARSGTERPPAMQATPPAPSSVGDETAQAARLESAIVRLGALAGQVNAAELVLGVVETAREITGSPVAMFVPADQTVGISPALSSEPHYLAEEPEPSRVPLLAGALWRVSAMVVDDIELWDAKGDGYGRHAGGGPLRSWLGAPVRARYGDALGVLFLAAREPGRFGPRDELRANALASFLGGVLDNLSLFQERARVAGALQRTLLPPLLPDVPGLAVGARYRPAKSVAEVGGDFYDLFELRPGVWGFLLGDVAGVGPEAAALTGIARYAVRALAPRGSTPAQVLMEVNKTLFQFNLQEKFCTALYAEVRPDGPDIVLTLANAGHPYPVLAHPDGSTEELEIRGTLLGIVPEVQVGQADVRLAPGDVLATFTDGVIEARGPLGDFFGHEGVVAQLRHNLGENASTIARRLELAVSEHQAGGAPDDTAIVVMQNANHANARPGKRSRRRG